MTEYDAGDVIDPVDDELDPKTLRAVQHAIRGFPEMGRSPSDLSEYRAAKRAGYSAVMAVISRWLAQIEDRD